jgi:hypothetical protein
VARSTVGEFVDQIERRSSLLSLTGYRLEDGKIVALYEFKHLTFQEYLTAVAQVEGYSGDGDDAVSLAAALAPYLEDTVWREIIPLAAVLAGRKAGDLVARMIEAVESEITTAGLRKLPTGSQTSHVLVQCLTDEVLITPALYSRAIYAIAGANVWGPLDMTPTRELLHTKYGQLLRRTVTEGYMLGSDHTLRLGSLFGLVALHDLVESSLPRPEWPRFITDNLASRDVFREAQGAMLVMQMAFQDPATLHRATGDEREEATIQELFLQVGDALVDLLESPDVPVHYAACWAFAWLGRNDRWDPARRPVVLRHLLRLWRNSTCEFVQSWAAWALAELPILDRSERPLGEPPEGIEQFLKDQWAHPREVHPREDRRPAALIAGLYFGTPWSVGEIRALIDDSDLSGIPFSAIRERTAA